MALLATKLRVRKGVVAVRVRCAARCRFTLRLRGRLPGRKHVSTLASGTRSLRAGRATTVHLKLNRAARKAMRRHRTLKISVSMRAKMPSGASARAVRRAQLRRA
jgi:hypothetical protein